MGETKLSSGFAGWVIAILLAIILIMKLMWPTSAPEPTNQKPETVKVDGKTYDIVKSKRDTVYVPGEPQIVYRPGKVIHRDSIIYVEIPPCDDTIAMLNDYFAKKIYTDTLKLNDSLGYVIVKDTLAQNSIFARKWDANINKWMIHDTLIVKPQPKTQWYGGISAGVTDKDIISFAGPALIVKNKKDQVYNVGLMYMRNSTIAVQGGMYWRIGGKKKK